MIRQILESAAAFALAAAPSACAKAPDGAAKTSSAVLLAPATPSADRAATAVAYDGCSAEDALAIIIVISGAVPGAPDVVIEIAALAGASLPTTIILSPLRRADPAARPFARAAVERGGETYFLEGAIIIETLEPGTRITGTYRMKMGDGQDAAGSFDAVWRQQGRAMCG